MIEKISIQNFKSLKNVDFEPCSVSVIIGPNNSGKTNFFKAISSLSEIFSDKSGFFNNLRHNRFKENNISLNEDISFEVIFKESDSKIYFSLDIQSREHKSGEPYFELKIIEVLNGFDLIRDPVDLYDYAGLKYYMKAANYNFDEQYKVIKTSPEMIVCYAKNDDEMRFTCEKISEVASFIEICQRLLPYFNNLKIYKPDIKNIIHNQYNSNNPSELKNDASNLIPYLSFLKHHHKNIFNQISNDLSVFNSNISELFFKINKHGKESLYFVDNAGNHIEPEDVSDGLIYFLAILAIIHQHTPPRILLLEEPERNLHPRRIAEPIELIKQIAQDKNIQIIFTTHSPIVLNEFKHHPECVFSFEMQKGETLIKNLQKDIIMPQMEKFKLAGITPINFYENLGEAWLTGFLGGVPE